MCSFLWFVGVYCSEPFDRSCRSVKNHKGEGNGGCTRGKGGEGGEEGEEKGRGGLEREIGRVTLKTNRIERAKALFCRGCYWMLCLSQLKVKPRSDIYIIPQILSMTTMSELLCTCHGCDLNSLYSIMVSNITARVAWEIVSIPCTLVFVNFLDIMVARSGTFLGSRWVLIPGPTVLGSTDSARATMVKIIYVYAESLYGEVLLSHREVIQVPFHCSANCRTTRTRLTQEWSAICSPSLDHWSMVIVPKRM